MSNKSYDDLAEEYADKAALDEDTYRGDVTTAFVCGMMARDEQLTQQVDQATTNVIKIHHPSSGNAVRVDLARYEGSLDDLAAEASQRLNYPLINPLIFHVTDTGKPMGSLQQIAEFDNKLFCLGE